MKKIILIAAVLTLMLSACGKANQNAKICNIENTFITHDSLDKAEKAAGIEIQLPDRVPNWVSNMSFRTSDTMLEVIYVGDEQELRIRKAAGSEDISGIYEDFSFHEETSYGDRLVTLKGDGQSLRVAIWKDSKYTYSVTCCPGMNRDAFENILRSMVES